MNHGHHANLTLQEKVKLKVSFDYIDWINSEFGQIGRENYYKYRKFGILPETEYEINKLKKSNNILKSKKKLKYREIT